MTRTIWLYRLRWEEIRERDFFSELIIKETEEMYKDLKVEKNIQRNSLSL